MKKNIILSIGALFAFSFVSCNSSPTITGNGISVSLENVDELVGTLTQDTVIVVKGKLSSEDLNDIASAFRYKPLVPLDPTVSIDAFLSDDVKIVLDLSKTKGIYELTDEFQAFDSLKKIILPNTLRIIRERTFTFCSSLEEVVIPASVTEIEPSSLCFAKYIEVSKKNSNYSSYDGVLYNKDKTELILCPSEHTREIKLYDGTEVISEGAFVCCNNLREIKIPKSVVEIKDMAFFNCESLMRVTLPNAIAAQLTDESISNKFFQCYRLSTILDYGTD